jgi:ADP-dependent NAD(P)H-hydrate dehydratase / NAD(P)H-hydrate epimerase
MFAANSQDMRDIDKRAIKEYGIPGIILMENAAHALLRFIKSITHRRVTIVCGGGNNGGDGFALGRLLLIEGYYVDIFCFADIKDIKGDARVNFDMLIKMGITIGNDLNLLETSVERSEVTVDAIFGTGLRGRVEGTYYRLIEAINLKARHIVSVDIPSGINGETGEALGTCIYARDTITFGCLKLGHLLGEGRKASGKVVVENISLPRRCIEDQNLAVTSNYGEYPLSLLKMRGLDTNKGDYGKVYIIGGSHLMSGAVALSASAAISSGAGLVTCVIPESILDRVGVLVPEAIYSHFEQKDGHSYISYNALNSIMEKASAIAFGVGLGDAQHMATALSYLIQKSNKPLIIDADGINMLTTLKEKLKKRKCDVILTPHPGEMSRLTGLSIDHINKNRLQVAGDFAREHRCILLLKGSSTVVTDGKMAYINTTGNPGMATGGSGDVLTGLIAALVGQGYSSYEAAILGANIHGLAGDDAHNHFGYGLKASDIIKYFGKYIR